MIYVAPRRRNRLEPRGGQNRKGPTLPSGAHEICERCLGELHYITRATPLVTDEQFEPFTRK